MVQMFRWSEKGGSYSPLVKFRAQ